MSFRKNCTSLLAAASLFLIAGFSAPSTAHAQQAPRNIELILDASGSMNGKLRGGTAKIVAAKLAVKALIGKIPGDINLSFRAYGHQFHRSKHVCNDTALIVPFGRADKVAQDIVANANALSAQGYTPISLVLGLAAEDLKPLSGSKTIILVSDGKETCQGDPCLLAKQLADANTDLVIHTVGFGVDFQTKSQLQCIANVARGKYFDANSTDELARSMTEAVVMNTEPPKTETVTIKVTKPKTGTLEITNVSGDIFGVYDAETDKKVATAAGSDDYKVALKTGIYYVEFGKSLYWRSIQIVGGETTVISPGKLIINNNEYHKISDPETGDVYMAYSSSDDNVPLPPGTYNISFGKALWNNVVIRKNETTTLDPGVLVIENNKFHYVLDPETGKKLVTYSNSDNAKTIPPGTYDVSFGKALWKGVVLKAGEKTILKPAILIIENNQFHTIHDAGTGEKLMTYSSSDNEKTIPPGTYDIKFSKAVWKGVVLKPGEKKTLRPAILKIHNNQYHYIKDAKTGKKVAAYANSQDMLALPAGDYSVSFEKTEWMVRLEEGRETVLNPGGLKITPPSYQKIYFADSDKIAGDYASGDEKVMLVSGKYFIKIGEIKVPFTITEGRIIEIKVE